MENFYSIKAYTKGQRDSFEELSCEIFYRELISEKNQFSRFRGDGGDGGVEALFTNDDGSEIGIQAKYWENNAFSSSEKRQLSESLKTAYENHPKLKIYFITIPFNLTGKVAEGKRGKSQTEQFSKWKEESEQKYQISIVLWNSTMLSTLLHKHDNTGGLYKYWFDEKVFTDEQYSSYKSSIIAQAGKRYTPELSVKVPLFNLFKYFSEDNTIDYNQTSCLKRFIDDDRLKRFDTIDFELINEHIKNACNKIDILFASKQISLLDELNKDFSWMESFLQEKEQIELEKLSQTYGDSFSDTPNFRQQQAKLMCEFPASLLDRIREVRQEISHIRSYINSNNVKAYFSKTLIITGPAGIGKTHSILDYVCHKEDTTDFIFFGEDFSDREPWKVFIDKLGFPSTISKFELFELFSIKAKINNTTGIIFIDAINESSNIEKWKTWIPILICDISKYTNLKLCISCRDTYLNEFVEVFNSLLIINHDGFVGNEHLAIESFCQYYGINPPSHLLFQSEFNNPLFLHLLCETIQDSSMREFPRGQFGLQETFSKYIEMKNTKVAIKCDVDKDEHLMNKVLVSSSEKMFSLKRRYLTYSEFKEITMTLHNVDSFSRSLANVLEKESVITKLFSQGEIRIRFTYDRLTDFYIANYIIENDVASYLSDTNNYLKNKSIIEMLAILLPENKPAVEILDYSRDNSFCEAFLNSLPWRSSQSITDKTISYVERLLKSPSSFHYTVSKLLSISIIPNNPLNAHYFTQKLIDLPLINRDVILSSYFLKNSNENSIIWTLINRACLTDFCNYSEESLFLWANILCIFCSSSDRRIRDKSSKALTRILINKPIFSIRLLEIFKTCDEYIVERLVTAIYSSLLLSSNKGIIQPLIDYIENKNLLSNYSNIIINDNLRLIIEYALITGLIQKKDYKLYLSKKSKEKFAKINEAEYQTVIQNKVFLDEKINFVGKWYTDFQRYILGYRIGIFDLEESGISTDDIYKWFVVELSKIGYPEKNDIASLIDNDIIHTYGSGRGKPVYAERLSKKYYWIFLHRLIGLLQNSCKYKSDDDESESLKPKLLSLDLRDIDLTDLRYSLKSTYPQIDIDCIKINESENPKDWVLNNDNFVTEETLIKSITDKDGNYWIPLYYSQMTTYHSNSKYPMKEFALQLSSSFCSIKNVNEISDDELKDLNNRNVFNLINQDYKLYLGEYPKSRSYFELCESGLISENEDNNAPFTLIQSSFEMLRENEWEYDCSFDSKTCLAPSRYIIDKLKLTWDADSGWINQSNELVVFSTEIEGKTVLLINKSKLQELLNKNTYLLFRSYQEKIFIPSEGSNQGGFHSKRGIFLLSNQGLKRSLNWDDVNNYRENN